MKSFPLLVTLMTLNFVPVSAQENKESYPLAEYLIDYGGCVGSDSLAFQSIGNDLFQDAEKNIYYLCFDRSDETGKVKTPLFIKRFRTNCDGELLDSDSIHDLRKTIDLPTFKELGNGYYKDFSNKYYFESMADGGEFRIVYNDLHTYTSLEHQFFRGDDGKLYIQTQNLISPPENYGPIFYRRVPDIDVPTYREFNSHSDYKKDKNSIYWEYGTSDGKFIKQIPEADWETFQVVEYTLAKDKKFVYVQGIVVNGLDPKSVKKYSDYEKMEAKSRK
ncbi:DKNYY domain-containing protein [Fluviicola sp.]|uniref:DKNYY domain-containing protein n=1 Tax=Fluviicola sp. TaxID=1917219 RepID=UPI003D2D4E97